MLFDHQLKRLPVQASGHVELSDTHVKLIACEVQEMLPKVKGVDILCVKYEPLAVPAKMHEGYCAALPSMRSTNTAVDGRLFRIGD